MPRRKSSDTSERKVARTRSLGGCNVCRKRKVKCGEERPECQRCMDIGYHCEYNLVLKWQEEFARRGVAFGRSGYYVHRLCPLTTPNQSTNSPFATIVLPFALSTSKDTFHSLLALSACHKSKTDQSWEPVALQLKAGMLQFLRQRLSNENPVEVSRDPEVLTITMIMCLYEIISKCDEKWVVYLRGARDLIRIRKQLPSSASEQSPWEPLFLFAERFFAYQDVLGRTACGGVPNFKSCTWNSNAHEIDISMGCSPELFQILGSITDLIKSSRRDPRLASGRTFIAEAARLEFQLENLVQTVYQDDDCAILHSAELKKQTAILYLHCTLYNASPTTPLVNKQVREVLQGVSSCLDDGLAASLTWPVFVAGVELDPLDDTFMLKDRPVSGRAFILSTLANMSASTVANVQRIRSAIIDVWRRRDLFQLEKGPINITQEHRSDWEIYVEPASMNLSLG
ncbi:C6 zinc finger domain protein [Rutstroemia sp. NJR-2017a BBW]|nr:C6 zinc finger domain protein [Rutstroemia sp. NJR-2017a BBW]